MSDKKVVYDSFNQKNELFRNIWKIAEDLRGKVDGWEFKSYVLGLLFYRYISENLTNYINDEFEKAKSVYKKFEILLDEDIDEPSKNDVINAKGFFIYPSQLFINVLKKADENIENLNINIKNAFNEIENSSLQNVQNCNIKGIFNGIDLNSDLLGKTTVERNKNILKIMSNIASLELGNYDDSKIDIFGDAYEFLMGMYASNAGKSGGEFFTPQEVSKLLTMLAIGNKKSIKNIYDPACGSGSLLLWAQKLLGYENIKDGFYGQDSNYTTYNLCRMNMFLHNIDFNKFNISHGDTIANPCEMEKGSFDVIVCNPPYSIKWEGDSNPILINDSRYSPAGVLAPKSYADYAFIMHALYLLQIDGLAAIVCFPGIFYRGGAEAKIRKWLVDNNYIDLIISLPSNLFFGTTISTYIMVLSKSKKDNSIMFIDASNQYIKEVNQNKLSDENINYIVNTYLKRNSIDHFSSIVSYQQIVENDYDLSVSNYIKPMEVEESINIKELNEKINQISNKNMELRSQINEIIRELEK